MECILHYGYLEEIKLAFDHGLISESLGNNFNKVNLL